MTSGLRFECRYYGIGAGGRGGGFRFACEVEFDVLTFKFVYLLLIFLN